MSHLKPRRSHQRRYMRSSISAQSWLSVPPAPALMVRMALARSCSPPSIFWNSAPSTVASRAARAAPQVLLHVLARRAPVFEDPRVVFLGAQALQEVEVALEALPALHDLLGLGLVRPELGGGHPLLEGLELSLQLAFVKDSRGCPRPSRRGCRGSG